MEERLNAIREQLIKDLREVSAVAELPADFGVLQEVINHLLDISTMLEDDLESLTK